MSGERFPAEAYARTVLEPLFDTARRTTGRHHLTVDRAHLVMLAETGILDRADATALARALAERDAALDLAALRYDGKVEDLFFALEGALAERVGADLAGRLHTGRSRNDLDHTVFKLALKARIDALATGGRALAATLLEAARRERDTLIVAYTHGQPAQPSTFGHYLAAGLEVLLRDLERLAAARTIVDRCPMGAAAITTTGFPIDRLRMAELLGFAAPLLNSYGCIAAVDYVTATLSAVELLFTHLGRIAQDFQFWTAFEVGQLHVPDAWVQISSIMPQKRNPVAVEHLRLLCSLARGRARAIVDVMHNTPFADMNDSEGEVQAAGAAAFESGGRALALMQGFVGAVRIDAERVRATIEASCITVTELADTLVRREGLSFREAHGIAGRVAKGVIAAGRPLAQGHALLLDAFRATVGRATAIDEATFRQLVSPEHFVAVRDRPGGPASAALDAALAAYSAELDVLEQNAATGAARERRAADLLAHAFTKLEEG